MPERVLTLRELNRATLSRQMLLGREALPVSEAVGRLVGLQAQETNPPYVGLWTRLRDFGKGDLTRAMEERRVVRATLMRSTLHLMTSEDYLLLRPALQPALTRALGAFFGKRAGGLDIARLVAVARDLFEEGPCTFAELRNRLSEIEPDRDPDALAYAVRTHLPLVQVPPGGTWGSGGRLAYALPESWLGRAPSGTEAPRELVLRYLAAFGPSSVKDVQAWTGMVRLKDPLEEMRGELRTFREEAGVELLDLPDAPLPPADAPAPPRFVPAYDNLILSHADRTRVISDEHRKKVFLSAGRVRPTILIDGFVRGAWNIPKTRADAPATLVIEPFEPLTDPDRDALIAEGENLLRFATEPDITDLEVRFD